jgi:hypothetical protein
MLLWIKTELVLFFFLLCLFLVIVATISMNRSFLLCFLQSRVFTIQCFYKLFVGGLSLNESGSGRQLIPT